ncbi:hypothetical protein HGRIS_011819 [Hohenbuehelia grisea]|uniref:DASH complex subunit DAM1 n=1 Tax=Hohenbuehelia grisea TaxID=104357 RepID=A0ABR3JWA0_9AGAR
MSNPTPHRTPLRRISQGSLFALSRSGAYPDAPHGLGFIEPAMSEFVDEAEALQANVEGMKRLSDSLATFNESFASWLYVMQMNALTTDWPQAPTAASFELAKRRAEQNAIAAMEAMKAARVAREMEEASAAAAAADRTAMTDADTTYAANNTTTNASALSAKSTVVKKKPGKPKLNAKEKKERSIQIEKIITCLPLEFRGNDPNLRRNMESVIEGLIDAPGQAVKLNDLIKPPDLPQARVNKCLIALVNRKIVRKDNSTGTVMYHWLGVA